MNKTPDFDDEMLPEYQFDYHKAKPNRFAQQQPTNAIAQARKRGLLAKVNPNQVPKTT
ncbi:MAG: hypothetical protein F6K50_36815 [Moorea sp. SIO3I7]|uniref:hypothetical protein n=1 Tax=unclassified Moorena TaxID=2683338 RepID=UPI0013C0533B|nr:MULTISPECIES: hypothetical protein [unclassified Moorena]NEO00794.1 hypothetical protein [Moorena sp. SIO3I7]NEO64216.1 hypothetical protein [Moorena sp. SIO4G2]NEO05364.1 hypothetical protein [Moorena sp. SIO3I8]NEO22954.1 hypothetical protein [Moorena sp. SIO4A5]NEP22529.1 hypothetical protein [Moorena sp. SIO3I6]